MGVVLKHAKNPVLVHRPRSLLACHACWPHHPRAGYRTKKPASQELEQERWALACFVDLVIMENAP